MHFTKLQGLGNDFVLVDARGKDCDWGQTARLMCRLHFGIGADGLLLLLPSEKADFRMRIFNPDGTEAEACGNGLRCFVRYLSDNMLTNGTTLHIETMSGVRQAKLITENNAALIQVCMGQPKFAPAAIPVNVAPEQGKMFDIMLGNYPLEIADIMMSLSFISMGNPHAIHFTTEPVSDFPLSTIGPLITKHALFPRGTNFEVARVIDCNTIEMRVWERGAGETLACGSGACASAIAAQLIGLSGDAADVLLPGGRARVQWNRGSDALLTGPAEPVFSGEWHT
ncbi:MAG: diaminopimelate epimerase [Dehalococcoidia bacterium]|nr:diaminopimelate epimerase [Dehalococcoidia bacterium]